MYKYKTDLKRQSFSTTVFIVIKNRGYHRYVCNLQTNNCKHIIILNYILIALPGNPAQRVLFVSHNVFYLYVHTHSDHKYEQIKKKYDDVTNTIFEIIEILIFGAKWAPVYAV